MLFSIGLKIVSRNFAYVLFVFGVASLDAVFFIQAMLNDMEIMMKFILLSGNRGDL